MTIPQLFGLLPVGALMGNELATLLIHRSLFVLDVDEHLAAEQAIHRVLGRVMPPYMIVAIVGAAYFVRALRGKDQRIAAEHRYEHAASTADGAPGCAFPDHQRRVLERNRGPLADVGEAEDLAT